MTSDLALAALVTILSVHALIKFAFFFIPYQKRRALLDKMYGANAAGPKTTDRGYVAVIVILAVLLIGRGVDPLALLGGIWIGSTLITVYFHRFDEQPEPSRAAPPALSPLKTMSYAIQDKPQKAWLELSIYTVLIATLLYFIWA